MGPREKKRHTDESSGQGEALGKDARSPGDGRSEQARRESPEQDHRDDALRGARLPIEVPVEDDFEVDQGRHRSVPSRR